MKPIFTTFLAALLAMFAIPAWGQAINEDLKILASDGGADNEFGYSIAVSQSIIAVGARNDDDNGIDSGSAYLFDASTGAQTVKLLPDDGAAGDEFGFSIAISGGIVAVGAPRDDYKGVNSGSAYLFDASTGAQLAKLAPEDGASGDEFGNSIAIDDGIVAIGAWRDDEYGDGSGAAYLFDSSTGDQLDKLLPDTGSSHQTFGVSIAMDDGIVVIGARTYFALGEGYTFAKAYLFDVSTGNQIMILQADIENYNGDLGGQFGDAVDIDNDIVAVGAWGRSIFFDHSGAAYLFDATTGSQLDFIFPSDGHDRDHFGNSISIDNGVVAIGAHQDGDNGWVAGSAYLYDVLTGTQIDKLLASDGAQFDYFGSSIAIKNGVVAVGAIGDEDNGSDSGSAYIFNALSGDPITLAVSTRTNAAGTKGRATLDWAPFDGSPDKVDVVRNAVVVRTVRDSGNVRLREDPVPAGSVDYQVCDSETGECSNVVTVTFFGTPAIADAESSAAALGLPSAYALEDSYPNPFNPSTTIRFGLPESAQVRLVVYDVLGREVRLLLDGTKEAGPHEIAFDASDLPSGTYLYRLETPQGAFTRTMLLAK